MSWNIAFIGAPAKVKRAIEQQSTRMTGQSLAEYEDVKPHLVALVEQHVGDKVAVSIVASGHATFEAGRRMSGSVTVDLKQVYGLVE